MINNKKLPLFLHDKKTNEIFKIVVASIPKGTKAYLWLVLAKLNR